MNPLALIGLAVSLTAGAPPPAKIVPAVFDHKDWISVCDNTQSCTAMALAPDGEGRAYLSISRDGEPTAPLELKVVIYSDANIASGPVRLHGPGFEAEIPGRWSDDEIIARSKDPGVLGSVTHFLESDARVIKVSIDKTEVTLSLSGAQAALTWIDERQGRVGSSTALARKGTRPLAALPAPPEAPLYAPAPKGSAVEIKPVSYPKTILNRPELKECDKDQIAQVDERGAWRLGPDLTLWSVPCTLGAYNLKSVFFISDSKTGAVRPAPIPVVAAPDTAEAQLDAPSSLMNADFDPKTMILNAFEKNRGVGDCGTLDRFLWDGRNFQPLEIDYMPECRGVTPEAWPAIYRGRTK